MGNRLKKSFSNFDSLAKAWADPASAAKYQSEKIYCSNGYAIDDKIYSYGPHFLVAIRGLEINGIKINLISSSKYSKTTSRHIGTIYRTMKHSFGDIPSYLVNKQWNSFSSNDEIKSDFLKELLLNGYHLENLIASHLWQVKDLAIDIKAHNDLVKYLRLEKHYLILKPIPLKKHLDSVKATDLAIAKKSARKSFLTMPLFGFSSSNY